MDRGLWKLPDGRVWLRVKLGLVLMGRVMFSKSLSQFSVDRWGCVPSLLFGLRPNYGEGNEENGDLLQKVPCIHCYTCGVCGPAAGHCWPTPLPETPGHSRASLGLLWGPAPFSWVLVKPGSVCLLPPFLSEVASVLLLTLCHPMDCSLPGSPVNGILQARILEWVAISFSRGSSWYRDWTPISCDSCIAGSFFTAEPGKPLELEKHP